MGEIEQDFTYNVIMVAREVMRDISSQDVFDTDIPLRGFAIRIVLEHIDLSIKLQIGALYSMNTEESINGAIHDFYVAWKKKLTSRTT